MSASYRFAVEEICRGIDAVSGLRGNRKAFRKHVRSRRRARHLVEAAGDLAREIARAGGRETPRVAHARAEVARLG